MLATIHAIVSRPQRWDDNPRILDDLSDWTFSHRLLRTLHVLLPIPSGRKHLVIRADFNRARHSVRATVAPEEREVRAGQPFDALEQLSERACARRRLAHEACDTGRGLSAAPAVVEEPLEDVRRDVVELFRVERVQRRVERFCGRRAGRRR